MIVKKSKGLRFTQIAVGVCEVVNNTYGIVVNGAVLYGLDKQGKIWRKFPTTIARSGKVMREETCWRPVNDKFTEEEKYDG